MVGRGKYSVRRVVERIEDEMSKFCIFCGKPLEEGQECGCQQNIETEAVAAEEEPGQENESIWQPETVSTEEIQGQQPLQEVEMEQVAETPQLQEETVQVNIGQAYDGQLPQEPAPENPVPSQSAVQIRPQSYMIPRKENGRFTNYVKRCWVILTRFFAHPVQIIRIAAEKKDVAAGLFFWILNAIIAGILPAFGVPQMLKRFLGTSVMQFVDFPAGWIWLEGVLISLAWTASLGVLAFAFAKAMHSRASFKSVVAAVGVSCIGTAAITLISWLLMIVSPEFGLCIYLFTQALGLVLLYAALTQSLGIGQDKTVYCLLIALAIVGLLMAIYISGTLAEVMDSLRGSTQGSFGSFGGYDDFGIGGWMR